MSQRPQLTQSDGELGELYAPSHDTVVRALDSAETKLTIECKAQLLEKGQAIVAFSDQAAKDVAARVVGGPELSGFCAAVAWHDNFAILETDESLAERDKPVRVVIVGNVDASKSTTIGVLTKGKLDDGRGAARQSVMRHKHEAATGRTSSSHQFDMVHRCAAVQIQMLDDDAATEMPCERRVELIDAAGHERYLKSAMGSVFRHAPDYALWLVEATTGESQLQTALDHLLAVHLSQIPHALVITKVDLAQSVAQIKSAETFAKKQLRRVHGRDRPPIFFHVTSELDATAALEHWFRGNRRVVPILHTSNISGQGIVALKHLLSHAPARIPWHRLSESDECVFLVDQTYEVAGTGLVVGGIVVMGSVRKKDELVVGPDTNGHWHRVTARSLHCMRKPVACVESGQSAGIALRAIGGSQPLKHLVRRGMLLRRTPAATYWEMTANISVSSHARATMHVNSYAPVLESTFFSQTAKLVSFTLTGGQPPTTDTKTVSALRSGDKALVTFRFLHRPCIVEPSTRFVMREGRVTGVGIVIGPVESSATNTK